MADLEDLLIRQAAIAEQKALEDLQLRASLTLATNRNWSYHSSTLNPNRKMFLPFLGLVSKKGGNSNETIDRRIGRVPIPHQCRRC
jgi:hypothetical protein